jgi:hypothetical protein
MMSKFVFALPDPGQVFENFFLTGGRVYVFTASENANEFQSITGSRTGDGDGAVVSCDYRRTLKNRACI